jgi:uncharacterized repeat protein (TIGR01451 family)
VNHARGRDRREARSLGRGARTLIGIALTLLLLAMQAQFVAGAKSPEKDKKGGPPTAESSDTSSSGGQGNGSSDSTKGPPPKATPPGQDTDKSSKSGGRGDASTHEDDAALTNPGQDTEKAAGKAKARKKKADQTEGGKPKGISVDFVAAHPGTYSHSTGAGGQYNGRAIGSTVVEELEAEDFACGDLVKYFAAITVDDDADQPPDPFRMVFSFTSEATGRPGMAFVDVVAVGISSPDTGNENLDGDESATLVGEGTGSLGGHPAITGTVDVSGLDPGNQLIVFVLARLGCTDRENATGNLLAGMSSPVGQQTVPMKIGGGPPPRPEILVEKECPPEAVVGSAVTYRITVTNTGDEDLVGLTVTDSLLGDLSDRFPGELAVGQAVTREFTRDVTPEDPDPLVNEVTASATGAVSDQSVSDTDECSTSIASAPEPAISVTKSCPEFASVDETITYRITVTNSGNEELVNLSVVDSLLGNLSSEFPDDLAVGASVTREFTREATEDDIGLLENTVTASATGIESQQEVSDTDTCVTEVTQVLPVPPVRPEPPVRPAPEPPGLAVTGAELALMGLAALALVLAGIVLSYLGRKEDEPGT